MNWILQAPDPKNNKQQQTSSNTCLHHYNHLTANIVSEEPFGLLSPNSLRGNAGQTQFADSINFWDYFDKIDDSMHPYRPLLALLLKKIWEFAWFAHCWFLLFNPSLFAGRMAREGSTLTSYLDLPTKEFLWELLYALRSTTITASMLDSPTIARKQRITVRVESWSGLQWAMESAFWLSTMSSQLGLPFGNPIPCLRALVLRWWVWWLLWIAPRSDLSKILYRLSRPSSEIWTFLPFLLLVYLNSRFS